MSRFDPRKYLKPKSEKEYEHDLKRLQAKLKTEEAKAAIRLQKARTKRDIKEIKMQLQKKKQTGRKKIKMFGRDFYV